MVNGGILGVLAAFDCYHPGAIVCTLTQPCVGVVKDESGGAFHADIVENFQLKGTVWIVFGAQLHEGWVIEQWVVVIKQEGMIEHFFQPTFYFLEVGEVDDKAFLGQARGAKGEVQRT